MRIPRAKRAPRAAQCGVHPAASKRNKMPVSLINSPIPQSQILYLRFCAKFGDVRLESAAAGVVSEKLLYLVVHVH